MRVFFHHLRDLLIADPYLISKLGDPESHVRVGFLLDSVRPSFPLITFYDKLTRSDPWALNRSTVTFGVDLWGKQGLQELENLYYNQEASVMTAYGSVQGIRSLLHGQGYSFDDLAVLRIVERAKGAYDYDEISKSYRLPLSYAAEVLISPEITIK